MRKKLVSILVLIVLSGCSTLRSDYSMSAIEAGYPTAESSCNGKKVNGLGVCTYTKGEGPLEIEIQGYYEGVIQIDSELCKLHDKVQYTESKPYKFSIKPNRSCVIDIIVSPIYPRRSDEPIRSFKGRLYVKYLKPGFQYHSESFKVVQGTNPIFSIKAERKSRVIFRGCGSTFDKILSPKNGLIDVRFSELDESQGDCIFEGVMNPKHGPTRITWSVYLYDAGFTPLAVPVVKIDDDDLVISADQSVGIISFGEEYKFDNKATFSTDNGMKTIRLITTAGRLMLGVWENGEYKWIK